MKINMAVIAALTLALATAPGLAQDQDGRDLCSDRPGLGTPPCTVAPGRVVVELGLADWTRERDTLSRTDTVEAGDLLLRFGLTDSLEGQVGWTAYGHQRVRDRIGGAVDRSDGTGDMRIALRQNLHNPDGSGFSIALMPYATVPTGGSAIGAGDWGVGLLVPLSQDLGGGVTLGLTPEIDAAVDADGDGRHLAYGSVGGLGFDLGDALSAAVEASLTRDRDPSDHSTQALAGISLGWQPTNDMQFDIGLNIGLNADSPASQLYVGVTRRF